MQLSETKDLQKIVNLLDLTLNEGEVYFYLLRNDLVLGSEIYTQLKMDKSSCYRALNTLRTKNLVYSVGEERNQRFGANDPAALLSILDEKQKALEQSATKLEDFIESLKQDIGKHYLRRNVTVLNGLEGHRQLLESRLASRDKLIREIGGRTAAEAYFTGDYDTYMQDYILRRSRAGIFLKQLVPYGEIDNTWERSSKKMNKEARELPQSFIAPAMLSTWDDKTGFMSKENDDIVGFVVRDTLITRLCASMFDMIWTISSKNN